jgi:hypothetical protein
LHFLLHAGFGCKEIADANRILCVYQLSGQYCLLNRLLYHAFLISAVVGHSYVWLAAGALASALTYSGTAVIHAIALAGVTANGLFDLHVLGA